MADYGYGDATPDSAKHQDTAAKYGYEAAGPDDPYGYGDATPDTDKYGYGDATPDTDKYGYGDATPDTDKYGYGDATPDTDKYGYGDAAPAADKYGYGEDSNDYGQVYHTGYNDESNVHGSSGGDMQPDDRRDKFRRNPRSKSDDISISSNHSAATAESYGEYAGTGEPRRQRYRRRGSVTKYSLDAQDTVQKEYETHEQIIERLRANPTLDMIPQSPLPTQQGHAKVMASPTSPGADEEMGDEFLQSPVDNKKDKKKGKMKNRFRRFTMGF